MFISFYLFNFYGFFLYNQKFTEFKLVLPNIKVFPPFSLSSYECEPWNERRVPRPGLPARMSSPPTLPQGAPRTGRRMSLMISSQLSAPVTCSARTWTSSGGTGRPGDPRREWTGWTASSGSVIRRSSISPGRSDSRDWAESDTLLATSQRE